MEFKEYIFHVTFEIFYEYFSKEFDSKTCGVFMNIFQGHSGNKSLHFQKYVFFLLEDIFKKIYIPKDRDYKVGWSSKL